MFVWDPDKTPRWSPVLNFYVRCIMCKSRDLEPDVRKEKLAGLWQIKMDKFQATYQLLIKQFKDNSNHQMDVMRKQFDKLLQQFCAADSTLTWREGWLGIKVFRQGNFVTSDQLLSDEKELTQIFLRNDYELISDIWSPLIDVFGSGFLVNPANIHWAKYLHSVTAHVLNYLLTETFRLDDPRAALNPDIKPPIPTEVKTTAIRSADFINAPSSWPQLMRKPGGKWILGKSKITTYGKLNTAAMVDNTTPDELAEEIEYICNDSTSPHQYPSPPPGLPKELPAHSCTNDQLFEYLVERINKSIQAITAEQLKLVDEKAKDLQQLDSVNKWMLGQQKVFHAHLHGVNSRLPIELIGAQAKAEWSQAPKASQVASIESKPLPPGTRPPSQVFHSWQQFFAFMEHYLSPQVMEPQGNKPQVNEATSSQTPRCDDLDAVDNRLTTTDDTEMTEPPLTPTLPVASAIEAESVSESTIDASPMPNATS